MRSVLWHSVRRVVLLTAREARRDTCRNRQAGHAGAQRGEVERGACLGIPAQGGSPPIERMRPHEARLRDPGQGARSRRTRCLRARPGPYGPMLAAGTRARRVGVPSWNGRRHASPRGVSV